MSRWRNRARAVRVSAAGVLGVALSAGLLTLPAASARADPLYVPWSSLLPGWTSQFNPSSANDCVAGRPQCVKAALRELNWVLEQTGMSCSHNAVFALSYMRMTQSFGWSRGIDGYYQDVPFATHQGAVFARYYTDAYIAWERGRRDVVPKAWLTAFDAAHDKKVTGSGDLLLGMNAHINRDLPFVLAEVGLVAPDGTSRKPDFARAEHFLNGATGPMLNEAAARLDPAVDDLSEPTGVVQTTLFQLVTTWRETAWRHAEALVSAPDAAARAHVAQQIESYAQRTAEALLLAHAYLPPLTTTGPRDRFCAQNHAAAAPQPYPFGSPSPYGL